VVASNSLRGRLGLVALVAVAGFQLRSIITGVSPVLPAVRDDLHLSYSAAGALSALPVLCLGAAALPGAVLVNRYGARAVVGMGTVGLGLAALLRLSPPEPLTLYVFSALMALCVAVAQPGVVVLLRAWFPGALQPASTVYATSLGVGGLAGATLSVHLLALAGWRGTFVIWALPAIAAGLAWLVLAPRGRKGRRPAPSEFLTVARDPAAWHVAALFGGQSLIYYGAATWIPFQLRGHGAGYLALVLLLLNAAPLPVGLLLIGLRWPWALSRRYYAIAGALAIMGTLGFATGLTGLAWVWSLCLSIGIAMTFSGATALPALFARRPGQVASFAALVLTAGYAISFAGPLGGGFLVDRTHVLASPFWLMVGSAALLTAAGLSLPRRQLFEDAEAADGEVSDLQPFDLEPAEPGGPDREPAHGEGSHGDRSDGNGPDGHPDGRHRQRAPRQD
jgi:MFS transporter, CP family, cyanate transporter